MGKDSGSQTQKTKNEPWEEVQPFLKEGYDRASDLYAEGEGPEYFQGKTYVPTDPLRQEAWGISENYARNQLPTDLEGVRQAYGSLMGALDVNNNPYLAKAVQGAINPMIENFQQSIMPSIRGGDILAGQYGGSEGYEAAAQAGNQLTKNIGDVSSQMYSNAYQQGLDTTMKSMMFAPQIMSLSQLPAMQLENIGIAREGEQGKALTDEMSRWDYGQQLPYNMLNDYMNILNSSNQFGTSISKSSGDSGGSDVMGAIGAVASIAAMFY